LRWVAPRSLASRCTNARAKTAPLLNSSNRASADKSTIGIGSAWDQLKSLDRINKEIDGDLDRLVVLHDFDRWTRYQQINEIEGFRIFKVA
jgi:hypothetical protein